MRLSPVPFCFLLSLVFSCAFPLRAELPSPPQADSFAKWENSIAAFEEKDRQNPPPKGGIVFVGSSSIAKWTSLAGDFPHHQVLNRGFGGSQLIDSVHFADRIVLPYEPRLVVLYAGSNDIHAGKSPQQVFADFCGFVKTIRAKLPDVQIDYISIATNPARWPEVEQVKQANTLIATYIQGQKNLKFIDVFSRMLGSDGLPRPEIFSPDRLHMNAEGYKLWMEIVAPELPASDR